MSFHDQVLNKSSEPGEKMVRIVTAYRPKIYTAMVRDEETRQLIEVVIGEGSEIAKEINTTEKGAIQWHAQNPDGAVWVK